MKPGRLDLTFFEGADFDLVLTWNDGAGHPVPLGGFTGRMQVRSRDFSGVYGDSVLDVTTANGRMALGGVAGTITIHVDGEDLTELTDAEADHPTRLFYDLLLLGATRVRLLEGGVTISPPVTLPA